MAIISKMTIRYLRRAGFPSYSHVEMETTEEILLEEGDDARTLRKEIYANMAEDMAERIAPIAAGFRKVAAPAAPPARLDDPYYDKPEPQKPPQQPATTQATLPEPIELPSEREPGRDMPAYSEEGKRIRGVGQKSFRVAEINAAWKALADAQVVETTPDDGKSGNENRKHIREWLKMSPLDPKFSEPELLIVVEAYDKWKGQGLTTSEAMLEVGNDYAAHYTGTEQYELSDDAGSADKDGGPADSDQEAEEGEDGPEPDDQGVGENDGGETSDDEPPGDIGVEDPEEED